ncbi:MAG TPA: hypothetical protein VNJ01_17895 [Bacteriovoracaceae bacterium]|nr:hypothetical protein [Bacteriovoracaceae bacterium]
MKFLVVLLFAFTVNAAFAGPSHQLLLKKVNEVYEPSQSDEDYMHTKTCEFFEDMFVITHATGQESSQSVEPATYSVKGIQALIAQAANEELVTSLSGTCDGSSVFIDAFMDDQEIQLQELIFCNSHKSERKGAATRMLTTLVNRYCPSL